ncbi:uncharacterized protein [Euwallacea similis]|uniref:uncharacterized protein n=1 Tax=Euwallacea similis TaxID=1736056 RepID=UPI00344BD47C
MFLGSSQESESDRASQEDEFKKPKSKKRGRKPKATPSTPTTPTPNSKRPAFDTSATASSARQDEGITSPTTNTPPRQPTFSYTFMVLAAPSMTRVQLALEWEKVNNKNKDIIIKQDTSFLVKTNDERKAHEGLQTLVLQKAITSFKLLNTPTATSKLTSTTRHITPSYSVVATGVELDITDEMFLRNLERLQLKIRFCKRIISRQRGVPTLMMRLITGDLKTYEQLITDRMVHFLGRIYRIVESKPPAPIPSPCGKCSSFEHRTEDCKRPISCSKCQGNHPTTACTSPLPIRCATCNAADHAAWSMKCPRRPTAPIKGIPNVRIKCLNRKSAEVSKTITNESRVHSPITTHDYIINKYKHQLNKTNNNNREELLKKLNKQCIEDFNIETSVVFFGSHMYILMFDLLLPNRISPTEPRDQLKQTITNTEHSI